MLIFISGSINSGKTTTSKMLAKKIGAKYINVDDLNDTITNFNLATDLDKSMNLAIATINKYLDQGHNVVANYVVRKKDWDRILVEVKAKDKYIITLAPRLEVAQTNRGKRELTKWEVDRIKYHYDTGIASPNFGYIIDNSDISLKQTVQQIITLLK
jgi:predicted kinase